MESSLFLHVAMQVFNFALSDVKPSCVHPMDSSLIKPPSCLQVATQDCDLLVLTPNR